MGRLIYKRFEGVLPYGVSFFLFYMVAGLAFPYFPVLFREYGFSYQETSYLGMVRPFLVLFIPPLCGAMVVRYRISTRKFLVVTSIFYCLSALLFLVKPGFTLCVAFLAIHYFFREPIKPMMESNCLEFCEHSGRDFGRIRLLGSLGFIVSAFLGGYLFESGDYRVFVVVYFLLGALSVPCFLKLKDYAKSESAPLKLKLNKNQGLLLLIIMFRSLSHAPFIIFFSIFLKEELQIPFRHLGYYWFVAVIAEMILMYNFKHLTKRFHFTSLMGFALICSSFRWYMMSTVETSPGVIGLQTLHAFTFGCFYLASIEAIETLFPGEERTMGLTLSSSISLGLSMIIGMYFCGWLQGGANPWSIRELFAGSAILPFLSLLVLLGLKSSLKKDHLA